MIELSNISFSIGQQPILNDVSCKIESGKLTALVGPNGAGKSTLIRLISRESEPLSGGINWFGQALHSIPLAELARSRAVLAQQTSMSLEFPVNEVVMMGRYPHFKQVPATADYEAVEMALEMTEMGPFDTRPYTKLSGGEQQRVQLARAFAQISTGTGPFVLILDEPLNNLDLRHQHKVLAHCQSLVAAGNLVIVVLHDLNLAAQYADDILLMKNGGVIRQGGVDQVLNEKLLSATYEYPVRVFRTDEIDHPIIFAAASTEPATFLNNLQPISSSSLSH